MCACDDAAFLPGFVCGVFLCRLTWRCHRIHVLVDMNVALSIKVEVEPGLEGKHFALAKIRAYTGSTNQHRVDNWQTLAITVAPLVPVKALPKRLHTAFCVSAVTLCICLPCIIVATIVLAAVVGSGSICHRRNERPQLDHYVALTGI